MSNATKQLDQICRDARCHELAAIFLGDEPDIFTDENVDELAGLIQRTIEDQISRLQETWRSENGQFGVGA